MPYEWASDAQGAPEKSGASSHGGTVAELHAWPYRSLPRKGFALFILGTVALISLPLFASLGTVILWGLLPFLAAAVGGVWWALSRSYRDGEVMEVLSFTRDRVTLVRHNPGRAEQRWEANPYWVAVRLYPAGGKVPQYLTLKGEGREVELGAFLTEEERVALADEIRAVLARLH